MTSPFADRIEQAMDILREQQSKMTEVRKELSESSASVTSKDRMITAKVGPQGQVISLTFHTTGYRSMAPAELSKALVDVLNEARADMGTKVIESMRSFDGMGEMLRQSLHVGPPPGEGAEGLDLDELLAPLRAMRPNYEAELTGRTSAKQEEFNG
ncbi:YbaB/EbfC family nucleoid-associated protein [Streptacidiphilus albus]|uniref:YbaB/EbfC family nucleoid-associated protein n=1 Tax=Streptacidiphilus albus TaxID=105425 RepID=UPI00068EF351|nr:YbaB/EbfC family nucleoid-associated protein [Streptacidiphilus albus]